MKLDEHPTVRKVRAAPTEATMEGPLDAAWLKRLGLGLAIALRGRTNRTAPPTAPVLRMASARLARARTIPTVRLTARFAAMMPAKARRLTPTARSTATAAMRPAIPAKWMFVMIARTAATASVNTMSPPPPARLTATAAWMG